MNREPPSTAHHLIFTTKGLTLGAPLISVPGVVNVLPGVGVAHVLQAEDLTSSPAVVKDNPPPRGRRVHSLRAAYRSEPRRARKAYRIEECKAALRRYEPWGGRIPTVEELPTRQYLKKARRIILDDPKTKRLLRDNTDTGLNKTLKRVRAQAEGES
jgi:hypothetical protein